MSYVDPRIDLDRLTPEQEDLVHQFLDLLEQGKAVSCLDFPRVSKSEFEALANAVVREIRNVQ